MTNDEEKNQLIETYPEPRQMSELADKDIKSYFNCIPWVKKLSRDITKNKFFKDKNYKVWDEKYNGWY